MRIVDILKKDGSMPERPSLLSSSSRSLLSRLLASIKPRKTSGGDTHVRVQVESADHNETIVKCHRDGGEADDEMGSGGSGRIGHEQKRIWKNTCFRLSKRSFRKTEQLKRLMSDKNDGQALPPEIICERAEEPIFQNSFQSWENESPDCLRVSCSKSTQTSSPSGIFQEGSSFHFGIGIGLAVMLANNKMECNKMVELRKQMEVLLRDIKYEILKKEGISEPTKTYMNPSYAGSSSNMLTADYPKFHPKSGSENNLDQLEAELEAELELLQLNTACENWGLPDQEFVEVNIGSSSPHRTQGVSFREELSSREEDCVGDMYGVSPYELERRLHQLIETRQQERIAELESALEHAEKLLHEKEMEICWCQDHANTLSPN